MSAGGAGSRAGAGSWLARRFDTCGPSGLYVTLPVLLTLLSLGGFIAIAEDLALASPAFALDSAVVDVLHRVASPVLTYILWVATLLGDGRVMTVHVVLASALLLAWGRIRYGVALAVLMLAGPAIGDALKDVFARSRPPAALALIADPGSSSFPSGHALASLLFYGALALFVALSDVELRWKVFAILAGLAAILAVGISRVYLGVHWPSDVLGSWLLGVPMLSIAISILAVLRTFGPAEWHPPKERKTRALLWSFTALGGAAALAILVAQAFRDALL